MAIPKILRSVTTAIVAALAYWVLLWASYSLISGFYILNNVPRGLIQFVAWFTLVNATGVLVAAVPFGMALRRWSSSFTKSWAISVGVAVGFYIVGSGLIKYGPPPHTAGWVVDALQFVLISTAPLLALTLKSNRFTGSLQRRGI